MESNYLYDGCGVLCLVGYVILSRPLVPELRASVRKLNSDSVVCGFCLVWVRFIVGFETVTIIFWVGVALSIVRRMWIEDFRETNPTLLTLRQRMNLDFILWPEHAKEFLASVTFPDPLKKAIHKMLTYDSCHRLLLRIKMEQPEPWPLWTIRPSERLLSEYDVGYEIARDPGYFTRNADEFFLSRALAELCAVNSIEYRWYWCTGSLPTTRKLLASVLRPNFAFNFREVVLDAAPQLELSVLSATNGSPLITLAYEERTGVTCYGDPAFIGACGVRELVTVIPIPEPSA